MWAIAGLHAVILAGTILPSQAAGGPVVAAMDDPWQSVLRRWVGNGWKPFHGEGYNFQAPANTPKRWGAGLQQDGAVAFAAICDACSGVRMRLLDQRGKVLAEGKPVGTATALTAMPMATEKGSIELTAVGCRAPTCVIRYTSFSRR
ncbi:MAG: hypothetical protein GX458_03275 [Phyllobacteriaceae bacterium]|nr:hypothetical protein [Phyllobacteriaceae bacterium]